jgi:hypothetical protein
LGLGIFFPVIFNDMYRMIRPMVSFQAMKIDKKCKHLLNFPAVILHIRTKCKGEGPSFTVNARTTVTQVALFHWQKATVTMYMLRR